MTEGSIFEDKLKSLIEEFCVDMKCTDCNSEQVIQFYESLDLQQAMEYACDYGKVKIGSKWIENDHFKFFGKSMLIEAKERLLSVLPDFANADTFLDIYEIVRRTTLNIDGLKRMFYYDVSFRIAASRGRVYLPKDVFYQRGAEEGAIKLGIIREDQIDEDRPYIPYKDFLKVSKNFELLKPYEIEDFLCLYKSKLDFAK